MSDDKKRKSETGTVKRRLTGVVVSHTPHTAVVLVARKKMHPVYQKAYRVQKKYHAHDPKDAARVGDTVVIEAARPTSALKRWQIV